MRIRDTRTIDEDTFLNFISTHGLCKQANKTEMQELVALYCWGKQITDYKLYKLTCKVCLYSGEPFTEWMMNLLGGIVKHTYEVMK